MSVSAIVIQPTVPNVIYSRDAGDRKITLQRCIVYKGNEYLSARDRELIRVFCRRMHNVHVSDALGIVASAQISTGICSPNSAGIQVKRKMLEAIIFPCKGLFLLGTLYFYA